MDQRSVVLYLVRKGLIPLAILRDLEVTIEMEVTSYQSLRLDLREAKYASPNRPTAIYEPQAQLVHSDNAILLALTGQPFTSVRPLV
jgi:hypothetical protein